MLFFFLTNFGVVVGDLVLGSLISASTKAKQMHAPREVLHGATTVPRPRLELSTSLLVFLPGLFGSKPERDTTRRRPPGEGTRQTRIIALSSVPCLTANSAMQTRHGAQRFLTGTYERRYEGVKKSGMKSERLEEK